MMQINKCCCYYADLTLPAISDVAFLLDDSSSLSAAEFGLVL